VGPVKRLGRLILLLFALALSSESVRTGVAGELRLKKVLAGKDSHIFAMYLCGRGTV